MLLLVSSFSTNTKNETWIYGFIFTSLFCFVFRKSGGTFCSLWLARLIHLGCWRSFGFRNRSKKNYVNFLDDYKIVVLIINFIDISFKLINIGTNSFVFLFVKYKMLPMFGLYTTDASDCRWSWRKISHFFEREETFLTTFF